MWSEVLLILVSLLSAVYIYRRLKTSFHLFIVSYAFLAVLALTYINIVAGSTVFSDLLKPGVVLAFILVLCMLLLSIRIFQPSHLEYPAFYSYVPLILLPFYVIFIDGGVLSHIIIGSMQITAFLVFALIVFRYQSTVVNGWMLIAALFLFLAALSFYWGLPGDEEYVTTSINLFIAGGMLLTAMKYPHLINENKR